MNNTIWEIENKFKELKLSFINDEEYGDLDTNFIDWWLRDDNGAKLTPKQKEFKKFVEDNYGFKQIKHYSGPDYDDWSQGTEVEGFTVIQLNDKFYKLTYEASSYGGIICDDFWNWVEVTKVDRKLTFYE